MLIKHKILSDNFYRGKDFIQNHMQIRLLIMFIVFLFFIKSFSQEREYYIELKYHNGNLLKHSPKINPLVKGKVSIYELNVTFPTNGKKEWAQLYNYPDIGFGYNITLFNNPEMLGNAHSLNMYIRLPIIKTQYFNIYYHFAMAPSYFKKVYDSITNPLNLSISSHINMYLHAGLEAKISYSKWFSVTLGYGMNHYSFGNLKQPNVGLNVSAAYGSMNIAFLRNETKIYKNEFSKFKNLHELWIWYAAGWKETDLDIGRLYFISTLSVNYAIVIGRKHKIGCGAEYFYDKSLEKVLIAENVSNIRTADLFRPGINISHEQVFGKLAFITQLGRYIYSRSQRFGWIYYRAGFRYNVTKNFFGILTIKAHIPAIADFVEWGVGFNLISK